MLERYWFESGWCAADQRAISRANVAFGYCSAAAAAHEAHNRALSTSILLRRRGSQPTVLCRHRPEKNRPKSIHRMFLSCTSNASCRLRFDSSRLVCVSQRRTGRHARPAAPPPNSRTRSCILGQACSSPSTIGSFWQTQTQTRGNTGAHGQRAECETAEKISR